PFLGFRDSALKVSTTDTKLYRDIAGIVLTVDERSARLLGYFSHLLERNATAIGCTYWDIRDGLYIFTKQRQEAYDHVKTSFPIEHLCHCLSSNCRLHGTVHVACQYPVTCSSLAVHSNQQVGLPQLANHAQVGHARHSRHNFGDLLCRCFELNEVRTKKLDGVFTLHA